MPKNSKAKLEANARYYAKAIKQYGLGLNIYTDADIIAKLDEVPSKMGYIKELIRADIKRGKKK